MKGEKNMKKGTKLAALLLGLALVIPACNINNSSKAPEQSSADPASEVTPSSEQGGQGSSEQINYTVTISNKDALQAEWFAGDQSRKVEINIEPKANITQLVNEGVIQISSSNAEVLSITGQMASPVAAGEATITVKCGESQDTVAITLKAKQTVKEKYGVAHEGTEADPFTNEEACKVAKADNYNNEDFYVQGKVASFYHLPGSRSDGAVSFFLEPATAGGEKFEVYKCYKSTGSGEASYLTDDDIWVGGIALAHGTFTTYGDQAETTGAKLIKCEGNKPQPRQTLTKTFAEVLAVGAALADGDATWDYYKFQGYVTKVVGNDYYLTATKGEALVPGKSDAAHGERDIKGTNAIELYGAGKVEALAAKLLKNAKVEVTMVVKNYHGTVENGLNLTDADVTVKTAGEPWVIDYQDKTVAEALTVINALEDGKTAEGYYAVTGVVAAVTTAFSDQYKNISFTIGDTAADTNLLTCFRVATDAETAAKIVAGAKVIVKGQLQKYVKDGAMTPELINGKVEIVPEQVVTYTTVGSLSFNKDATVVIDNKLDQAADPFINYASTSGVAITVRKNTSNNDVNVWKADYASCRWYVGHKVNIAHAQEFDRVVLTCDSGYDAFKPEAEGTTIAALKAAGITYASEGGKITLDLATPAKSIEIVPDKQIRPSNVELLKSNSGETPATALKEWDAAETKAGLSNASAKEVKDTTGDVQFTVYKLGTKNDYVEFKFTPTEAKKVVFNYTFTTKHGNADKTYFWNQDAAITSARKHQIFVNGTEIGYPAENPSFQEMAGENLVKSEASDSGELANPITVALFEFDLVANQENVIKIQYIGSGYSTYVGGAKLIVK